MEPGGGAGAYGARLRSGETAGGPAPGRLDPPAGFIALAILLLHHSDSTAGNVQREQYAVVLLFLGAVLMIASAHVQP